MTGTTVPGGVGAHAIKVDAHAKVTGVAAYPADRIPADALHATAVFTNQPHARLVRLDTSAAEAMPGVVAVFTAADVPVNEYGLTEFDQPVLIGVEHTGRSKVPCDVSRWEADHLAIVVAETPAQATAAAAKLEAEWEPLPIVADLEAALADDAPIVHTEIGTNVYHTYRIRKGSMDEGWAKAAVVIEDTYDMPYQEHAYLQPEAGVAYIDDEGRITVEVAGQWTHEDQEQIAHALDLPMERVRVIYPAMGGAFGGREDMSIQIVLALAAWKLADQGNTRPIAAQWSREESIVGHHKRHRAKIYAKWGADANGKIVAVHSEAWLDAGAYNYTSNKVLGNCHLGQAGPYEVDNAYVDSHAVYTNGTPGGAFRGFGGPQAAFVAETQMNRLAEALGLDPVEIRRRNTLKEGSIGITQVPMPAGVTMPEVIERCATEAAFDQPLAPAEPYSPFASVPADEGDLLRGRGFACSYKNVGFSYGFPERCNSKVILHGDGDTPEWGEVFYAGADVGQGTHTTATQMAAESTGVPQDKMKGRFSDTSITGDSGSASASRLTFMSGNSIKRSGEKALAAWKAGERPAVGECRYVPPATETLDPETGAGQPNFCYGYVAQAVEVTVDRGTGYIRVDRVVSTHDVGKAINPTLVVGQIEGALGQAQGYVLSERLRASEGHILNPRLSTYLIPGIGDMPTKITPVVLELADPNGPWGARGMAEMPLIPYAPAVIAAIHDATGIWFTGFPLTPDRVLAALEAADK